MDDRTQPVLKTKFRDMIFPDFPDDENTVTTTVTKSRRVSFGTNLVKEFIVGSAVSAQCVSEYEQAFSSSDSSNANSSYSAVESGILDQNTFVVEEKSKILQPIPPPNGSNIPDGESLERTLSKRPKFGSTICFSADSPTADMEFTEGCLTLAKSILDKKNKEMTVIIQAKPKEEEKTKDEETKYFDGSQFDMSMTKCFKSKENKREDRRFDDEKTKIFSSQDDDMSMTKCDKLFRMRQVEDNDSDENMEDDSKENQIPLDLIMRHLDKDKDNTDVEKFLFHPQKSLSDVLNAVSLDLSNDSEKLNLNESMDISRDFQPELLLARNQLSTEEKTIERLEKSSLSVTKTIEEQVYVSREEIILREEHLVLVQKEGESLTGIRTAYESSEEEKEEPEDAEMEITLTGSGNVISDAAKEKEESSNDLEVTKDTETGEEVAKTLKDTTEDEVIEKWMVDEKIDEDIIVQESKEMDVETETREMDLEVAEEQMDAEVSKEEEILKLDAAEDENNVVSSSQELSFSKQQEESGMDVSKEQISGDVNVTLTQEKETNGSLNSSTDNIGTSSVEPEGLTDNIGTSSVEPEEQKVGGDLSMTPEEKHVAEMTEEEEVNMSDMEMTLTKGKKSKEMTLDEVLKEITKDHEIFDEKVLEKYFEKGPEGDSESFLEKDMEDVEMQLDLDELNDDSVNKSVVSSLKESPKASVAPARASIRFEKSKAKPEERKESVIVEKEPPLADAKVIEDLRQQSEERNCVWRLAELSYQDGENFGFMSFNLKLLESSTTIKFRLKANEEEEGLFAWSAISSAEMELNPDEDLKTKDYKTTVMFGYELQGKYFREEKKMAKTTQHIPYFLDKMNSFSRKLDGHLYQIHQTLSSFPGSRLKGSVLSFRLFSFPLLFSSTVSIDLTDLFRLSKSSLSFNTEFGSLNENEMKEIFERCLNEGGPAIWPSVVTMTREIMKREIRETGRVSKRDHIPLIGIC